MKTEQDVPGKTYSFTHQLFLSGFVDAVVKATEKLLVQCTKVTQFRWPTNIKFYDSGVVTEKNRVGLLQTPLCTKNNNLGTPV